MMNTIDFSAAYGLEYAFPVSDESTITVNARCMTGFTNVIKKDYTDGSSNKNIGFAFTVGYRF